MTASAFTHRTPQTAPTADLLRYISMGGTLEDLCGQPGTTHLGNACEACRISDNALGSSGATGAAMPMYQAISLQAGLQKIALMPCFARVTPPSRAPPET